MLDPRAPLPTIAAADHAAPIAIVIPYRDRAEHLSILLPHLVRYFERDRLARAIPYEVHVAEQAPGKAFNRGAMKNAGFALAHARAECVVFHDVDYLPLWADYSRVRCPTSLITYGVQEVGTDAAAKTPGCVLSVPVDDFVRVNGYSNDYWGWGFEDVDLDRRVRRAGLRWERRDGTFTPLSHRHGGLTDEGKINDEAQRTRATYQQKGASGDAGFGSEGLSTLDFRVERTEHWSRNGVVQAHVFRHLIELA